MGGDAEVELGFDESADFADDEVVVITGADGVERSYALVCVVEITEGVFAVLMPEDPDAADLLVARYDEDAPAGSRYTSVDDEDTVARVQALLDSFGGGDGDEEDEELA